MKSRHAIQFVSPTRSATGVQFHNFFATVFPVFSAAPPGPGFCFYERLLPNLEKSWLQAPDGTEIVLSNGWKTESAWLNLAQKPAVDRDKIRIFELNDGGVSHFLMLPPQDREGPPTFFRRFRFLSASVLLKALREPNARFERFRFTDGYTNVPWNAEPLSSLDPNLSPEETVFQSLLDSDFRRGLAVQLFREDPELVSSEKIRELLIEEKWKGAPHEAARLAAANILLTPPLASRAETRDLLPYALLDASPYVRRLGVRALAYVPDPAHDRETFNVLIKTAVSDRSPEVRKAAADAIAALGPEMAKTGSRIDAVKLSEYLAKLMQDKDREVRRKARGVLDAESKNVVSAIMAAVAPAFDVRPLQAQRLRALELLANNPDNADARGALVDASQDPNSALSRRAIEILENKPARTGALRGCWNFLSSLRRR